jgi:hypothetical protein
MRGPEKGQGAHELFPHTPTGYFHPSHIAIDCNRRMRCVFLVGELRSILGTVSFRIVWSRGVMIYAKCQVLVGGYGRARVCQRVSCSCDPPTGASCTEG